MTQLPPERNDTDPATSDWHAMLAGDERRPGGDQAGASRPPAPQPAAPAAARDASQPMTRREAREAEQRRAAAIEAEERHAAAVTAAEAATAAATTVPSKPDAFDQFAAPSRGERRAETSDQYETERPRRRGAWGCLIGLVVVIALGVGAFFFLQGPITAVIDRFQPAEDFEGTGTGEVVFMIHEGDTGTSIADNLVAEDIVASAEAFTEVLAEADPTPIFYPGAYLMAEQMSAQSALDALLDPANKLENTFVIQEGMWAKNALAEAAAVTGLPIEELEAAAADVKTLGLPAEATGIEGFLFPATYTVDPDITAPALVKMLVDRSFEALDAAGVAPEDRWRTVVKASLIEREAGLRDDYYKVSRVIENRLDPELFDSGLLQFDSTVHYGLGDDSVVTTTDAQRADPANAYNTYVHPGLPPGPIGNPGDLAIDAALHPADGPWLYFVTVDLDTGETVFSATIDEHDAAVARFLAWLEDHPEYGG
ncbi:endolytic transglycosylase MltG [Agromyces sp. SYSU K20354]|uniref:endolytic transglycosylase MltG n=1 Tax=Agromyces cavernae TaxID=2898659 RepID=UPI001E471837|nr:endolytic transglycosylase MltG [Agromyces cavernae]MCD2442308.1 endolytic transglycosylase MltG [Agromyces cavernae]